MENLIVVGLLGCLLGVLYWWGFRRLPAERWQILACIPERKTGPDLWSGINLTYYGLFSATAYLLAAVIMIVLGGAAGIPFAGTGFILSGLLIACIPASRIVARIVEKKKFTFTVGGAAFVGMLLLPVIIWVTNQTLGRLLAFRIPFMAAMAAAAVAYAFGEGMGRLACISFGCCYGRTLAQSGPVMRRVFGRRHFIFTGKAKKISYESGQEGEKVIPVQAFSAVVNSAAGLIGMYLYLCSYQGAAFLVAIIVTQSWRAFSENLRNDHRGGGRLTAYQAMSLILLPFAAVLYLIMPSEAVSIDIWAGLEQLWNPPLILVLQLLWLYLFIRTGRSRVTGSHLSICIHEDSI